MANRHPFVRMSILIVVVVALIPWAAVAPPAAPVAAMPAAEPVTVDPPPELESQSPRVAPMTVEAVARSAGVSSPAMSPADGDSRYRRVTDLGDGRHQAIVSTSPLNYQAADGSWHPIDPRFERVEGGFVNQTNALQIVAAERIAALHLRNGDDALNWEPRGLWLVSSEADGDEVLLAEALGDDGAPAVLKEGGTAIHYAHSWSLPAIADQIVASPGGVEQSLVFAERPEAARAPGAAFLSLRAHLDLGAGEGVYLDGARQDAAFVAEGEVEVRNAAGDIVLILVPVVAYEQGNRAEAIAGRYRFAPDGEHGWHVDVQTPWAWWQAPERAYPAVLDPFMKIHHYGEAASTYRDDTGQGLAYCAVAPPATPLVSLGNHPACQGVYRTLVKFNTADFPTMPPGAIVTEFGLIAKPTEGYHDIYAVAGSPYPPVDQGAFARVVVSRVVDEWEMVSPGIVRWGSYQTSAPLGPSKLLHVAPSDPFYDRGAYFPIDPSIYALWQDPASNFGLELRLEDEAEPERFVQFPWPASTWTEKDRNWSLLGVELWPWDTWALADAEGGGFMLVITYQAPGLQEGQTYRDNVPPTDERDVSAYTEHRWDLPPITSEWGIVAVKGISGKVAAGHATLGIDDANDMNADVTSWSTGDASNYIVTSVDLDDEHVEVRPFDLRGGAAPASYYIEARNSIPLNNGNPVPAGSTVTYASGISSFEIARMVEVTLVEGTNVQVRFESSMPTVQAQLFPPAGDWPVYFEKAHLDASDPARPILPVETGGSWGLAVEYTGPPEWEPSREINIPYTVTVTACSGDALFTDQGCWTVTGPTTWMHCAEIGDYWVRSESPFFEDPKGYHSTSAGVYIGAGACSEPLGERSIVVTNRVDFNTTAPSLQGGYDNTVYLYYKPDGKKEWVWNGGFEGHLNATDPEYGYLTPDLFTYGEGMALPLEEEDQGNASLKINIAAQQAEGTAEIVRHVETSPGVQETFTFLLTWVLRAEGMNNAYSREVTLVGGPGVASIGPMTLRLDNEEWRMDFLPGDGGGRFGKLRTPARIEHSPGMGSGWQEVQAVILPAWGEIPAEGIGDQSYSCNGHCLDIRHPTLDTVTSEHRDWKVPDIEIDGKASTVVLSRPGDLEIFSSDHPNEVDDVTLPFSFKTYDGNVQVYRGACPGVLSDEIVQVVAGETQISLPLLGNPPGASSGIKANFTLCDDALRNVRLSYSGTPIPVGATGLYISSVTGVVTLTPASTQIEIDVDYRSGPSGTLTTGKAKVMLDTAGLLHAGVDYGKLIGFLNYDGYCDVTWSPLSFTAGLHGGVDLFVLRGDFDASVAVWQGQGWQHQYYWLPDNSDTHFAGSFHTKIVIPEGKILDVWWLPDIPPEDIELFTLDLLVGEFHCGSCADGYEYGIQGSFSAWWTLGNDVGLFVGFESGIGFILGGGHHKLVNQYPGMNRADGRTTETLLVGGRPIEVEPEIALDPIAPQITYPLTVTTDTTSFLAGLGWARIADAPDLSLVRPDGQLVTVENAGSFGVNVLTEEYSILFGVEDPMGDDWQAVISNVTPESDWRFYFAASNQVPTFKLLTPATVSQAWTAGTDFEITWQVPEAYEGDTSLAVSLYYSHTVPGVVTPTTGVIVDKYPFTNASFNWDTGFAAKGTYQVWGVLRNSGTGVYYEPPRAMGEGQWLGVSRSVAPGSLIMADNVAPAAPTGLTLTPVKEGMLACWNGNDAKDLAGYQLGYHWTDARDQTFVRYMRVPATVVGVPWHGSTPRQCARIGSLNAGTNTQVAVVAYDASGNVSASSGVVYALAGNYPELGPIISKLYGTVGPDHSVTLQWEARVLGSQHLIYYAVDERAGPYLAATGATEGPSPIQVGPVDTFTIHGLPAGRRVHFAVQAIDADGRRGPLSKDLALWLTNGIDGDGDGMPDDVESAYGLTNAGDDPDRDCLVNAVLDGAGTLVGGELFYGTNPTARDTDLDGFTDGEEVLAGSDPVDRESMPEDRTPLQRLVLGAEALLFRAGTQGSAPPAQYVDVMNAGGGTLDLVVSTNMSWLTAQLVGGQLAVVVDPVGLTRGEHVGEITVAGAAGTCVGNAPQKITVVLGMFEGALGGVSIYLPIVVRH